MPAAEQMEGTSESLSTATVGATTLTAQIGQGTLFAGRCREFLVPGVWSHVVFALHVNVHFPDRTSLEQYFYVLISSIVFFSEGFENAFFPHSLICRENTKKEVRVNVTGRSWGSCSPETLPAS